MDICLCGHPQETHGDRNTVCLVGGCGCSFMQRDGERPLSIPDTNLRRSFIFEIGTRYQDGFSLGPDGREVVIVSRRPPFCYACRDSLIPGEIVFYRIQPLALFCGPCGDSARPYGETV